MISTTAEYALRIMIVLAGAEGVPTTSEKIAALTKVPTDYSVKVLQMLARENLVRAQRGRGGGFRLSCDPRTTSMLDVINAIEPIDRIDRCPLGREEHRDGLCALHRRLDEVAAMLQDSLRQLTLTQVIEGSPTPAICPPPPPPPRIEIKTGDELARASR
jgi:Rrf2 family protein